MRKFMFSLILSWRFFQAGDGIAQYHGPYHHTGLHHGVHYGWGWWPLYNPGTWYPSYGYNYYPYWNYNPHYSRFGAIAYSVSTGRWGIAYSYPTRHQAEISSEAYCGRWDCQAVVWVRGGCATIAKAPQSDRVSYGYHPLRRRATEYALQACLQGGDLDCQPIAWVCSY